MLETWTRTINRRSNQFAFQDQSAATSMTDATEYNHCRAIAEQLPEHYHTRVDLIDVVTEVLMRERADAFKAGYQASADRIAELESALALTKTSALRSHPIPPE